ncbi:MAG: 1-deoxy-D-xylulose-5-phosphate reductoisomerase [Lentimicrobiaceae bacterium]|nr:1-deoxy-D-xylulose-5-phosphate reductoisomerase [Lentimicrobiaceae bacterium]
MKKRIALLGSTGSIGKQALEVVQAHQDRFEIEVLTADSNADLLIKQAIAHQPNAVVIANEQYYQQVKNALSLHDIKVYAGVSSLEQIVEMSTIDVVLVALVGFAGLKPTLNAIEHGKQIALANKETLVVGGELVMKKAEQNAVDIIPIDSEHSAIFQCLMGEWHNKIESITITASGGPFFGKKKAELQAVTPEQALKHPNWTMGNKVSIDSATLMNKGLEMIEARWLFDLPPADIQVCVHPQSIVHSLVHFTDGAVKAQLGLPDMRLPIQYALSYPHRLPTDYERFSFLDYPALTFFEPDIETFRCLPLAYRAIERGGNLPCILNAANEIAVEAFLQRKIHYLQIADIIENTMQKASFVQSVSLNNFVQTNAEARQIAREFISFT